MTPRLSRAAGSGGQGSTRSATDVTGPETLRAVREYEKAAKAKARGSAR